jgi:hypothetical protein
MVLLGVSQRMFEKLHNLHDVVVGIRQLEFGRLFGGWLLAGERGDLGFIFVFSLKIDKRSFEVVNFFLYLGEVGLEGGLLLGLEEVDL